MTNDLYSEEFQTLKKKEIFLNEIRDKFNVIINENKLYKVLVDLEDKGRFLFSPFLTVLELLYFKFKKNEPMINPALVKSVKMQKQEIWIGAIVWLITLMTLFIDWKMALSIVVFQMFLLVLFPSSTDLYRSSLEKKFIKSIEPVASKQEVRNTKEYSILDEMNFNSYIKNSSIESANFLSFEKEKSGFFFKRHIDSKYFSVLSSHELVLLLNLSGLNNEIKNNFIIEIKYLLKNLFEQYSEAKLSRKVLNEAIDMGVESILEKYSKRG